MTPTSIDQVIEKLESIIQWSKENSSRAGFFASLYLRVTRTIKSKIGTSYFENDERLESLDVIFANRYFKAFEQFRNNDPAIPKAWAVAFDAVSNDKLIIVQHLLLGISAHINIDLGVASAETSPGEKINGLEGDFNKVNDVLAALVPTSINEISELSPLLHLLEDVAEKEEEAIINFSIKVAREFSWQLATELAPLTAAEQQVIIDKKNISIAKLGEKVVNPGFLIESVLKAIHAVEVKNVVQIIDTLNAGNELIELIEEGEDVVLSPEELKIAPNHIYYFQNTDGNWKGDFNFKIKSWSKLYGSSIGMKNKFLISSMGTFQRIFGNSSIKSSVISYPNEGKAGISKIDIKVSKSWFVLYTSKENTILSPNGKGSTVDARVQFGPFSFLFNEHNVYPVVNYDGGFKAIYHMDLLGAKFVGNYTVDADKKTIQKVIENEWMRMEETLAKV